MKGGGLVAAISSLSGPATILDTPFLEASRQARLASCPHGG